MHTTRTSHEIIIYETNETNYSNYIGPISTYSCESLSISQQATTANPFKPYKLCYTETKMKTPWADKISYLNVWK